MGRSGRPARGATAARTSGRGPLKRADESTTQGRCLSVTKSVNGKGTTTTSPGSKRVIRGVVRIVPERNRRLRRLQERQVRRGEVQEPSDHPTNPLRIL